VTDARQPRTSCNDGTNTRFDSVSTCKEIKVRRTLTTQYCYRFDIHYSRCSLVKAGNTIVQLEFITKALYCCFLVSTGPLVVCMFDCPIWWTSFMVAQKKSGHFFVVRIFTKPESNCIISVH